MKYSDEIFSNKTSKYQRKQLEKLESKLNVANGDQIKKEKEEYVRAVTGVPEFEQTVAELSQYTMTEGSENDQKMMSSIKNKLRKGELNYQDVGNLNVLCGNNYKWLFKEDLELEKVNPTFWIGISFAIAAIILRVCYEFDSSNTSLMIFLTIINLIAIIYTMVFWHKNTIDIVDKWLEENRINKAFKRKILAKATRKNRFLIVGLFLIVLVCLGILCLFNAIALGNDIISIGSLAMSILDPHIIKMLANWLERGIYYNES